MTGRVSVPEDAEPSRDERWASRMGLKGGTVPPARRAAEALTRLAEAWDVSTRKIHERRIRGEEPW